MFEKRESVLGQWNVGKIRCNIEGVPFDTINPESGFESCLPEMK